MKLIIFFGVGIDNHAGVKRGKSIEVTSGNEPELIRF